MNILLKNYIEAVDAYVKEFEKKYEVEIDFWVGDEVGGVAIFGDEAYNFSDIKYMIDNDLKYEYLYDWYCFLIEFSKKCYINLHSYCKLRRDAENENKNFDLHKFEKTLLYMRISE
jgi:hypothetical protein